MPFCFRNFANSRMVHNSEIGQFSAFLGYFRDNFPGLVMTVLNFWSNGKYPTTLSSNISYFRSRHRRRRPSFDVTTDFRLSWNNYKRWSLQRVFWLFGFLPLGRRANMSEKYIWISRWAQDPPQLSKIDSFLSFFFSRHFSYEYRAQK